jgi:hypothetical protein
MGTRILLSRIIQLAYSSVATNTARTRQSSQRSSAAAAAEAVVTMLPLLFRRVTPRGIPERC